MPALCQSGRYPEGRPAAAPPEAVQTGGGPTLTAAPRHGPACHDNHGLRQLLLVHYRIAAGLGPSFTAH